MNVARVMTLGNALTTTGLVLDAIGVIILFKYGLPPQVDKNGYNYMIMEKENDDEKAKYRRYSFRSKIGLNLLLLGFVLQGVGIYA